MGPAFSRKYATATNIYMPIIKRAVVDFAVGADWTPAAGDVRISIDGAASGNITTLPVAIVMGNTAMWNFAISAAETTGKKISITIADAATKVVEDQMFLIETYGSASAEFVTDWTDDSIVRGVVTTGATTTSIPTSSLAPAASVTDQFLGRVIIFNNLTTTAALRGQAVRITGSTSGGVFTVTAMTSTPASGDTFKIV
jgi:hypothetical protein